MKKLFYSVAALAIGFAAASCQQEGLEPAVNGSVTYQITLPVAPQTKGENGYSSYDLHYEVYKTSDVEALTSSQFLFDETVTMNGNTTTVSLELLNDQNYTVLFWANQAGTDYYAVADNNQSDLLNLQMNLAGIKSNNDDRDAFCAVDLLAKNAQSQTKEVKLVRPFSQVNIGTVLATDKFDIIPQRSEVTIKGVPTAFNVATGLSDGELTDITFAEAAVPAGKTTIKSVEYTNVAMNYIYVPEATVGVEYTIFTNNGNVSNEIDYVTVKKNHRTYIIGNLLTSNATYNIEILPAFEDKDILDEGTHGEVDGQAFVKVSNNEELASAFADDNVDIIYLTEDIDLAALMTRSVTEDPRLVIKSGKTLTIDLNGKTLSAVSNQTGKNYDMIDVRGNLTVKNGTVVAEHKGENMGWSASTCLFNITAGGVLNLEDVTAKNLGGSDMAFVAHLNNWGEATINVNNSVLESTYIALRAFNSGYDMNNITVKNSTLKGKFCFWVHNYKEAGDSVGTDETLNLDILNGTNVFEATGKAPILYGFADPIYYAADGNLYVADGVSKDAEGAYYVSNAAGLEYMNKIFADQSAGRDAVLNITDDIDFAGKTWTTVDSHADSRFEIAEINGNGHTISNLTINGQAMFRRFAGTGDVVIKDITFDNANVDSKGNINTSILTVQTYQNVTLDNVDVKNSTIIGGYKVAPLIATVYNENPSSTITATLKNCDVENVTVKATSYDFCTTGMVAFVHASDNDMVKFENCTVSNVKLYAPNAYTAHAAIYTTGSETLFNEAEGVTVSNVTFENI